MRNELDTKKMAVWGAALALCVVFWVLILSIATTIY